MDKESKSYRGRGAGYNPSNSFTQQEYEKLPESLHEDQIETEYYYDNSESVLAQNDSPDVPFTFSLNPYRGCEHGCIYCYARPTHEYLDLSAGSDFESKIFIKDDAPELLRERFRQASWEPQTVALSGGTDPYQPIEEELRISRQCLEVFAEHRNPVSIITKNYRLSRDIDVLKSLAENSLVKVNVSITSLDRDIIREMEPRTSTPEKRLKLIEELSAADIPVGVNAAPMIPGLTDQELPSILDAASEHGAETASYIMVRLPGAVKELFDDWLSRKFPDRKDKVLNQIRSVREGKLNDADFGSRMKGSGEHAKFLEQLFDKTSKKLELNEESVSLTTDEFQHHPSQQKLF